MHNISPLKSQSLDASFEHIFIEDEDIEDFKVIEVFEMKLMLFKSNYKVYRYLVK
jgi:hypothetical protein